MTDACDYDEFCDLSVRLYACGPGRAIMRCSRSLYADISRLFGRRVFHAP